MRILVTGFEPFGGSSVNPSAQVVKVLAQTKIEGVDLTTCILPVDGGESTRQLIRVYRDRKPAVVLCLGEASQRAALSIERVAINLMDYRIPDNQGNQVVDQPIVADGPAAYFTTLPVRRIFERVSAAGIPVELSLSAGAFLCNQVLYFILHEIALANDPVPVGFIHLPSLPEQASRQQKSVPSMSLETDVRGVYYSIECIRDWCAENSIA